MNKFFLAVIVAAFFFPVSFKAQPARAGVRPANADARRTALVIGNAAYADAPLKNPVNDADDIAAALRELGFDVTLFKDLDQKQMKSQIRAFGEKLRGGGVGLFYYAGHGVQVRGTNYLIPIGAAANSEPEIEYEAVEAGFVLAQMEAANNKMNFVILDACRNNPFARSYRSADKGLAQMDAPRGSLIAYSTAPGSVAADGAGRNGIYTAELLKQIRTPNLNVEDVFKQVRIRVLKSTQGKQTPWESSSLTDDFNFTGKANSPVVVAPDKPKNPTDATAVEIAFWNSVKDSKDAEDYKEYLDRFPNGEFANLAQRRIKSLEGKPLGSPPPAASQSQTVEGDLFTFELNGCQLSGTNISCDLTVTNKDKDRSVAFSHGSLFDNYGNKIWASRTELANVNQASYGEKVFLASGVQTKARIIFERVSAKATAITLLSLACRSDETTARIRGRIRSFEIEFRNIPLRETSR